MREQAREERGLTFDDSSKEVGEEGEVPHGGGAEVGRDDFGIGSGYLGRGEASEAAKEMKCRWRQGRWRRVREEGIRVSLAEEAETDMCRGRVHASWVGGRGAGE